MRSRRNDEEIAPEKPFDLSMIVPRKRVGMVRSVMPDRHYGFITAEDFREDVFFHFNRFEPARPGQEPLMEMPVEFELDEAHRKATGKLKASAVRPTKRPVGKKLEDRDAPHLRAQHHARALRRKPAWRRKEDEGDVPPTESPDLS